MEIRKSMYLFLSNRGKKDTTSKIKSVVLYTCVISLSGQMGNRLTWCDDDLGLIPGKGDIK